MTAATGRDRPAWWPSRQFVLYGVIGATGATLDFLLYLLLTGPVGVVPWLATAISVSAGIVNNFIWNATLNFRVRTRLFRRFLSFYAIGIGGVLLSMAIVWVLTEPAGLHAVLAKLISIPPVVLGQYLLNKRLTFAQDPEAHAA